MQQGGAETVGDRTVRRQGMVLPASAKSSDQGISMTSRVSVSPGDKSGHGESLSTTDSAPLAPIFDIQRFSVHDGPGIRTLVFFKGCPLHCAWCSNPESQTRDPQLMFYPEKCIGCQRCVGVCETGASFVVDNVVRYDRALCNSCGRCVDACPADARRMAGTLMDVAQVMEEIEKDWLFYQRSNGGVTFGGGEATLYPAFVDAVALRCQAKGIHTAIETCGFADWSVLERATRHIDLVLYDVKHMESDVHRALCGQGNELILANLAKLCRLRRSEIVVRVPILPGLNDDEAHINHLARFVGALDGGVKRVELLAYHRFGVKKYERLGREYELDGMGVPDDEDLAAIKEVMESHGLHVKV